MIGEHTHSIQHTHNGPKAKCELLTAVGVGISVSVRYKVIDLAKMTP